MMASTLAKRLQVLVRRDGDFEIEAYVPCVGRFEPVFDVQLRRRAGAQPGEAASTFVGLTTSDIGDEADQLRYDNTPFGTKTHA